MTEYFIFLSASIGLTLSLIGLCLWLDYRRYLKTERLGGLTVYDYLELGGQLDRHIAQLPAAQEAARRKASTRSTP
jgi:hypothetical protein